jgi:hypothetical protein
MSSPQDYGGPKVSIVPAAPGQPGARPLSSLLNAQLRSDTGKTVTVTAADIAEYKQRHGLVPDNTLVIATVHDYGGPKRN